MKADRDRLRELWTEERRLNREWEIAAWREDWTEAARIRTEYNIMFQELISLCKLLGIIGGNQDAGIRL